ncbi:MAG TPA: hypothetical protein VGX23_12255 [Actinocrinis sp.]|nr:hypothetical protein [Actinocrinis sp.]
MAARPTDWSALGLGADPTPGDASQVQDVYTLLNTLSTDFQTIWDTLNTVNGYAGAEKFAGKTADALRGQMNGRLTKFVDSAHSAFSQAAAAMNTYLAAVEAQQQIADNLLTQAVNSGLKPTDPQIKTWATQATQAGTDLQSAQDAATKAIQSTPGPSDPLSPWQEFLKVLGILALILILPAMIFGGPLALVELVVNAVLFVNAIVNYAEGNISFGDLLLAALGVIAPTTRAFDFAAVVDLVKGLGAGLKSGFVAIKSSLGDFTDLLTAGGVNDLLSLDTLINLGSFTLKAGVWAFSGLTSLPSIVFKAATAFAGKLGDLLDASAIHLGSSLTSHSWLSLVLPIDAAEIEKFGLGQAFRLGFFERGLLIPNSAVHNLTLLNKAGFHGIGTGLIDPLGFGHTNPIRSPDLPGHLLPAPGIAGHGIPTSFSVRPLTLDIHIEAPTLSIGNLAAGLVHNTLSTGLISHVNAASLRTAHLEVPDLRFPPELHNIGQTTVLAKFDDLSFVTVHQDLAPITVHTPELGATGLSAPIHTGHISTPDMSTLTSIPTHLGHVSTPDLSTLTAAPARLGHTNVPTFTAAAGHQPAALHLPTANLHTPAAHELPTASLHAPTALTIPHLPAATISTPHELPNLSAIAHTQISTAHPTETRLTLTDHALTLNTTPLPHSLDHLTAQTPDISGLTTTPATLGHADVNAPNLTTPQLGASHLGAPHVSADHLTTPEIGAFNHLATPNAVGAALRPLAPPAITHLAGLHQLDSAGTGQITADLKTLQTSGDARLVATGTGIRSHPDNTLGHEPSGTADLPPMTGVDGAPVVVHNEAPIPAVSSAGTGTDGLDAHLAGTQGSKFTSPDLAGKTGLFDPTSERVAVHWTEFRQARHEYDSALTNFELAHPANDASGVGSWAHVPDLKGKQALTPAQADAAADLHEAGTALNNAAAALHHLDTDPGMLAALDHAALTASLKARPRLPGGSRPNDQVLSADPVSGVPIRTTRGLGPNLRLYLDHGGPHETGAVLDVHTNQQVDVGNLTEAAAHDGFRLTDPGDANVFREYRPDGTLHAQGINVTDHAGQPLGHLNIDLTGGTATLHAPGGAQTDGLSYHALTGGAHQITDQADGTFRRFDAGGGLVVRDIVAVDHDGTALGHLKVDYPGGTATLTDGAGLQAAFTSVVHQANDVRVTNAADGSWLRFDGTGHVVGRNLSTFDHDGTALGHLEVDYPSGTATLTDGAGAQTTFTVVVHQANDLRVTNAANGTWLRFDGNGQIIGRGINAIDHNGTALGHLEVDYPGGTATLTDGTGLHTAFTMTITPTGDLRITNTADGSWLRLDATGHVLGRSFATLDHNGTPLDTISLDYAAGTARFRAPGGTPADWAFTLGANGELTLTRNTGNLVRFRADGSLDAEDVDLHDLAGAPAGTHIEADHTPGNPPQYTIHDANGAIGHLQTTRDADGHFTVTDTRPGADLGTFTTYDRLAGTVRAERVNLQDISGMHVVLDHAGATAPALHSGTGPAPHFTVGRDPATGRLTLTDTRGAHAGDTRTFDAHGAPLTERISILTPRGKATGESFQVDFATLRWTRGDAAGPVADRGGPPAGRGAGPQAAYNGSGAVLRRNDGSLVLTGADKTPAFVREPLATGQSLELVRGANGSRHWTTWDDQGLVDRGRRHYSTEADGMTSWDVGRFGVPVREYRVAIDGGLIRAEKMPDGTFQWSRFTKDGDLALTGLRTRTPGGWKDTATIGGRTVQVQRRWNAFNTFGHATHYREHTIAPNPAAGRFDVRDSFKEISQQGKDTGSKDLLTGGHTLTFTRYAEQRPPDFLWKTPGSLGGPLSKTLARSPLGSKLGAIDFAHDGVVFGDSRFQVFTWVEHDPAAGGAAVSRGVRVVTPDGSFSDFAGDGVFARGAIKLDNGNTVEIGRDAQGKWDTFTLGPGGARPGNTLDWRELDSTKTVVAQGIRIFSGKHWTDTFADAAGNRWVVRHTAANGDVVHYLGPVKPAHDPSVPVGPQTRLTGQELSVTRNTMNQIVSRDDAFGHVAGAGAPALITGHGDPRAGSWAWRGPNGTGGLRISGRNTRWTGAWDDSFADFRTAPLSGNKVLVRDFRALDEGTSLRAEPDALNVWHSARFDADGAPVPGTVADRTWKQADGSYGALRPVGLKEVPWRDTDAAGTVLRELADGRVREYTGAGTDAWKEYDFGSVWRERSPVAGRPGLFLEKESFQKQWRVTNTQGTLVRYRSASGRVWEVDPLGTWTIVGTEREDKGPLTAFRGLNRRIREPNRLEFKPVDGAVGSFVGESSRITEKVLLDMAQEFLFDVAANIVITGVADDWNFSGDAWGRIILGGAIKSGVKGAYGVLTETALKGFRDGLRNLDGGKDFNRNPYNNDKYWDNEWAGNENPQRWRAGIYDYAAGTVLVPAIGNFLSTAITAPIFGIGKDDIKLTGTDALAAGGLGMAGNLVGNLSFGAAKTLGHQLFSGRLFHLGGAPDLVLTLGEKFLLNYLVNDVLLPAANLKAQPPNPDRQPG